MVFPLAKITIIPLLRLFIREVKGIKNVPKKGPFIIAANHDSFLDPLLIEATFIPILDRKIYFLAKKAGIWYLFGSRIAIDWAGCIPVAKDENPLDRAIRALGDGKIIGIFPEGTRSPNGKLIKAHTGVARMALEGYAVLPVGIKGTYELWPGGKWFPRLRREARLIIGKPMKFKKMPANKLNKKILTKVTTKIMKTIGNLINEEYKW